MKKIYLCTLPLLFLFLGLKSQSPTFKVTYSLTSAQVQNSTVFHATVPASTFLEKDFLLKNISAAPQVINIRKYEDLMNVPSSSDYAEAYFCTGINCYLSSVMSASVMLSPGEEIEFRADFVEASTVAHSTVRYKFTNDADNNDNLMFTIQYNDPSAVSVKNNSAFSGLSDVYPNPSSSKSFVNLNSSIGMDGVNLTVINSVGATLISKQINVTPGKNTISIDSENFADGIYFVSLNHGSTSVTKKITIIK
jgi:hypothetical protein